MAKYCAIDTLPCYLARETSCQHTVVTRNNVIHMYEGVCLYKFIFVCVYVCMYMFVYIYIYIYIYTQLYPYIHMHINRGIVKSVQIHMHTILEDTLFKCILKHKCFEIESTC